MRFYQNGLNCLGYPKCDMLSPQTDEMQQKNTQNTKKATLSREGKFLREYRQLIQDSGKERIVHVDECGFEPTTCRRYGWSICH